MAETLGQDVQFHELGGVTGDGAERVRRVAEALRGLATHLADEERRGLVWDPLPVVGPKGDAVGYVIPSVPLHPHPSQE